MKDYYTVGSSIFRKLYFRVFDFLTFILQGPQFCKNYTLWKSPSWGNRQGQVLTYILHFTEMIRFVINYKHTQILVLGLMVQEYKGPVKLIKRVKIAHSFLQSV